MAADIVTCPHCQGETRVVIPRGQELVRVLGGGYPTVASDEYIQRPTCQNCDQRFAVVTKES